jgi:tetratricopeptide (TPR) repeat protein
LLSFLTLLWDNFKRILLKFSFLASIIGFCLTWALSITPVQAQDTHKTQGSGPVASGLGSKEYTRSLSHYIVGVYCESLGDLERASQEYRRAQENDPQSSLLHLSSAGVLLQKDKSAEAIEELKRSIELDPQAVQPHALLALVYSSQGKVDLAADEYTLAFENASKQEPENVEIYKSLGAIYLQQKKLKQAEGIFKLILKLTPQDAQTHFYLGSVYYDLKDYPAAEKELKNALKLKPDYHEVLNFLGYFYLEQDRNIDTAGVMIKQALGLEPENGAYLDSLGWYYYKKRKLKEALSYLEKAAYFLSDPVIYEHLGDVFLKSGSPENAILNWEKSLKLNSEQNKVKEKLLKLTNHGK